MRTAGGLFIPPPGPLQQQQQQQSQASLQQQASNVVVVPPPTRERRPLVITVRNVAWLWLFGIEKVMDWVVRLFVGSMMEVATVPVGLSVGSGSMASLYSVPCHTDIGMLVHALTCTDSHFQLAFLACLANLDTHTHTHTLETFLGQVR